MYFNKHIYHLEQTQNQMRKICLPSAQNEIFLSFRTNRILSTQNYKKKLHGISFCVDLNNAK